MSDMTAQQQVDPFLVALRNQLGLWQSEVIWWQLKHAELLAAHNELTESFKDLQAQVETLKGEVNVNDNEAS